MKGLKRSIDRGRTLDQDVMTLHYAINNDLDITGVSAAVDAGTFVIGGLPQGNLLLLGAVAYISADGKSDAHIINNWNGDYGIGTAPNADVDLGDAEDDNIIPSQVLDAGASDKLSPRTRATSTSTEQGVIIDNTDGSKELNMNILIDDNVITDGEDGTFSVTGDLFISVVPLGDD